MLQKLSTNAVHFQSAQKQAGHGFAAFVSAIDTEVQHMPQCIAAAPANEHVSYT